MTTGNFKTTQSNFHKHHIIQQSDFSHQTTLCACHTPTLSKCSGHLKVIQRPNVSQVPIVIYFIEIFRSLKIGFTASAMDLLSVDFLHSMNVPFIKVQQEDRDKDSSQFTNHPQIGSGDVNHLALHTKVGSDMTRSQLFDKVSYSSISSQAAKTGRPLVVSTGMSNMSWVS